MTEPHPPWLGSVERGGLPVPLRADVVAPPHWRLEAVAATERPRDLVLAPDGRTAVFVWDRDTSDVWAIDTTTGATRRLTTGRALAAWWEDIRPSVSPDGSRVAYGDQGQVWVVPLDGGPPKAVLEGGDPVWTPDGLLLATVERDRSTILVQVDPDDPWPVPLAAGDGDCWAPDPSPDGTRVAYVFSPHADRNRSAIHVVDLDTGEDRPLTGTPEHHDRNPVWSPDGTTLAFTAERPGWHEIFLISADGARERQVTDGGHNWSDLTWHPEGDRLVAVRDRHGVTDLVIVEVEGGGLDVVAEGGSWGQPQWLADGRILAGHESFTRAPQLCVVEPGGPPETILAPTPAAVAAAPHLTPEPVSYTSFDGREIPGWLYRPTGASADQPVPAVVNPHGGPTDRDGDEWYGVAQYFADKGYAWFLPNFRGSTSWGREHEYANHGDWGIGDTKDCLAAHDFLSSLDWVDGSRIAIFGGSYGSYMALCACVDDPEHRYRAALTKYGDCDIWTSWAQGDRSGVQDMERQMPHPSLARQAYLDGSPIHRIDQLEVPILVAHGLLDERVHPAQSEELVEALRRLNKTFEYVTYPGEGHGFLSFGPQVDYYRRVERFLDWVLM
jgi:dipeptidyl aminopeptidase/acylaminoacyl peptidase